MYSSTTSTVRLFLSALIVITLSAPVFATGEISQTESPVPASVPDAAKPPSVQIPESVDEREKRLKDIEACRKSLKENPADRDLKRKLGILLSQSPDSQDQARAIFEELLKGHENSDTLMDLAACYYRNNFEETFKLCSRAERLNNGKQYPMSIILMAMAGSRYRKNDLVQAEKYYKASLAAITAHDPFVAPKLALAGLAGCYWRSGQFEQSAKTYEELYKLNRYIYGAEDVECGWSLLQESYAIARRPDLDKAQQDEKSRPLYTRAVWVFRKCNQKFVQSEYEKKHGSVASPEVVAKIVAAIFGTADSAGPPDPIPDGASQYQTFVKPGQAEVVTPWKKHFKQSEAPGWVWFDPDAPLKYVLLCVHGLGLHHRSYEPFARKVATQGVLTVAMDVRGFGTFVEANGLERLSMNDCVNDLKSIVRLLRKDYPGVPVFILGESMGGALALRVVSQAPEAVDGLICSVPSGSRHKGLSTAIGVGASYLKDKRKPLPGLGRKVVHQATQNSDEQNSWINDPSSRLNLSPQELLDFQKFMGENISFARKIKTTPVILFQGHNDKLVKEKGTLDLFDALKTPEKSIVILGNTEHLIFESAQVKDDLTLAVVGWMSAHHPKPLRVQANAPEGKSDADSLH